MCQYFCGGGGSGGFPVFMQIFGSHPQINPSEISGILNLQPQCGKNPANSQIQCTWKEGNRQIRGYWLKSWSFQRWESRGF